MVTLAGTWVWFAGARVGSAEASDGVDGDRMQMGDVTENGAGDDENGDTGNAMLDIICGGKNPAMPKHFSQNKFLKVWPKHFLGVGGGAKYFF